jgi:hypothetical protein
MAPLSRQDLEQLLEEQSGPAVSIYLPTIRAGAETQQNPIRFKNLVRKVETQLEEMGHEPTEIQEITKPLWEMQQDHEFWQHQQDGLAVFLGGDEVRSHKLPMEVDERVVVNDRFYLKPLFRLIRGDGRYYVLALSQKNVRLFEGSRYNLHPIDLPDDVPTSLVEVVGRELEEPHIQFHTGTATGGGTRSPNGPAGPIGGGSGGGRAPIFHGQGAGEEDQKAEISKFFHQLDSSIHDHLHDRTVPLVLAGVDYLLPIYRAASDHKNIAEEGIHGSPDGMKLEDIHEKSWEIVKPDLLTHRTHTAERFGDLLGSGKASSSLEEVVTAAYDGRVDTLFVAAGEHRWGEFDPGKRAISVHEEESGDDLLELAAVRTFLNGGTVYALDREQVPGDSGDVAAIFRY